MHARLSITVPADSLDAALRTCLPVVTAFNAAAIEIAPEATSNSLHGYRAHLLIVSPPAAGADEEKALRLAAVSIMTRFGAERKLIRFSRPDGRLTADVQPRTPTGADPAGVRLCGLTLMVGVDPFEARADAAAEPLMIREVLDEEDLAEFMTLLHQPITFEHERTVHLDQGTHHWVSIKQFRIDPAQPDHSLLAALVADPRYRDHYAGGDAADHDHHGPYRLEHISAETFQPVGGAAAREVLELWAGDATGGAPSAHVQRDLEQHVYPVLVGPSLFHLPDLRPGAEHDWGWVVGQQGFHEFVAVDRVEHIMTLIVASDD